MSTLRHRSRKPPDRPCGVRTHVIVWPVGRSAGRLLFGCEPRGAVNLSARRTRLALLPRHGQAVSAGDGRQVMALETCRGQVRISLGEGALVSLTARSVMLGIGGGVIPLFGTGAATAGPAADAGRLECLACFDGLSACVLVNARGDRFQIEIASVPRANGEESASKVVITRLSAQRAPMEQLEVSGLDCGKLSVYRSFAGALATAGALYGIEHTFERKLFGR